MLDLMLIAIQMLSSGSGNYWAHPTTLPWGKPCMARTRPASTGNQLQQTFFSLLTSTTTDHPWHGSTYSQFFFVFAVSSLDGRTEWRTMKTCGMGEGLRAFDNRERPLLVLGRQAHGIITKP
jgi:hypothetical protein